MTLYLKYRPKKISDLDLPEVAERLSKYLAAKSVPHAWLFSGPRGTGKTSSARILARAINCEHKKGVEPCNECGICQEITAGTAIDVIEIDAASNRGIDEIRELKEKIKLTPMRMGAKVYIIDEVHMLTTEAANALLKTLEEPPANTYFVLCTTEADKLLDTVVSRCCRIDFRKPNSAEGVSSLKRVLAGEDVKKVDDEALKTIVKAARGSFRDATKLLEQVLMTGEVTMDTVNLVVGMGDGLSFTDLVEDVLAGRLEKALAFINVSVEKGQLPRRMAEAIGEELRERLLACAGKDLVMTARLLRLINSLDLAYEQIKQSVIAQLPLEVWVIDGVEGDGLTKVQVVKKPELPIEVKPAAPKSVIKTEQKVEKKEEPVEEAVPVKDSGAGRYSLSDLEGKWGDILKLVRPKNHSVEALLRSTKPVAFDGEKLTLEVFYKFHKDKLETDKCRQIVEDAVGELFGVEGAKLFLKLGQSGKKAREEVSAVGVEDDIVKAAEAIFKSDVV